MNSNRSALVKLCRTGPCHRSAQFGVEWEGKPSSWVFVPRVLTCSHQEGFTQLTAVLVLQCGRTSGETPGIPIVKKVVQLFIRMPKKQNPMISSVIFPGVELEVNS